MAGVAALLALAAAASLAGCPGVKAPLEPPAVRAEIRQILWLPRQYGVAAYVKLSIANRSAARLTLRAIDWELEISGAPPSRARKELIIYVPGYGAQVVNDALHVLEGDSEQTFLRLQGGERRWAVRGVMHFESARGAVAAVFDGAGELPASADGFTF